MFTTEGAASSIAFTIAVRRNSEPCAAGESAEPAAAASEQIERQTASGPTFGGAKRMEDSSLWIGRPKRAGVAWRAMGRVLPHRQDGRTRLPIGPSAGVP